MLNLNIEEIKKVIIISIEGELFFGNIDELDDLWNRQVIKKPSIIAMNCKNLISIDSTVVGYFVKFLKFTMNKKIELVFFDLTDQVNKLFLTARLDKFFKITTKDEFQIEYLV